MAVKNTSSDNLKRSLVLGVIAIVCSFTKIGGPTVGAIIAIFGFKYGRRAAKEGKPLAIVSLILNTVPLLYLLLWLFVLGYVFTDR